jgi:hypothetical protein
MHQLLTLKTKLWLVLILSSAIGAIASTYFDHPLAIGGLVGTTEAVLVFLLSQSWPLATWLPWPAPRWMRINLTGEWKGVISSGWRNDNGDLTDAIAVTFDIRQSWLKITFSATTEKMQTAGSFSAVPTFDPHTGTLEIGYFFRTQPSIAIARENPAQSLGAAVASIDTSKPDRMRIAYTNERGPGGNIELRRVRRRG